MSSRAGIVGLAGFGLGVTTLATSKLVGADRGGGTKGFFKKIGTGIATPFKAIGKIFNPQLASKGNETNKEHTELHSKGTTNYLNKKLGKIENKLNIPKLSNKTPKLYEKQTSFNKVLKKHENKKKLEKQNELKKLPKKPKRRSHKLKSSWQKSINAV